MRRARVAALVGLLAMGTTVHPRGAVAGEPSSADKETARGLVRDGDAAFAAGDLPRALKSYRAAYDVVKVSTTGIEVVKTLDAMGKLVEARDVALEVTRIPVAPRDPPAFTAARDRASSLATELAERIPSLRIDVSGPSDPSAIELSVDGERVPAEAAKLGRKVNPGNHVVIASAPSFGARKVETTVKEREVKSVTLALVAGPALGHPSSPAPAPHATKKEPLWPLVYTGFIGGGALLAAGAVTGGISFAKARSLTDACDQHTADCTAGAKSSANALAWVSNITLPLGVVGMGLGIVGLFVQHDVPATRTGLIPIVGPAFVGARGTF